MPDEILPDEVHACSDHGCGLPAEVFIAWPGQLLLPKCEAHAAGWCRVAAVMGFELTCVTIESVAARLAATRARAALMGMS